MQSSTEAASNGQLKFQFSGLKIISESFDEGQMSSDGGLILMRAADMKLKLSEQICSQLGTCGRQGKQNSH